MRWTTHTCCHENTYSTYEHLCKARRIQQLYEPTYRVQTPTHNLCETYMIFVNTSLETAQKRNQMRKRTLAPKAVETMWNEVQNNIGKFQRLFGGFPAASPPFW